MKMCFRVMCLAELVALGIGVIVVYFSLLCQLFQNTVFLKIGLVIARVRV